MTNVRQCLECGERIQGRMDKRFCTDQCRSSHHNKQRRTSLEVCSQINYRLRKNHKILSKLVRKAPVSVTRDTLLSQGFHFEYITQAVVGEGGLGCWMVYDYGYRSVDDQVYELRYIGDAWGKK
jgi:predicted nucleic acid-binding Zn ribbon protein